MKIGFIISVYTEYENTMKNIHFLKSESIPTIKTLFIEFI
jgi:hypothetical protein